MITIAVWVIFIIVCAALATRVHFSDNIQDLRAKGNPGVVNQTKITQKFGQSFDFMMYVTEAKTLEGLLSKTYAAAHDLDALMQDHTIASFQSISTFLPPIDQQQAVMAELHRGSADRFNVQRIRSTFRAALLENGFRPEAYDRYMELFAESLTPRQPVTLQNLGDKDLIKL